MDRSRFELEPGVVLDARRAVWLGQTRTLVVADLHLGYAWAHRAQGQMLPISMAEDTLPRLLALVNDYTPAELVLLGDIVHRTVEVAPFIDELGALIAGLSEHVKLRLILGNHDARLAPLLCRGKISTDTARCHEAGGHLLLHGDTADQEALRRLEAGGGGRVIIGHEHPAISISDGVATSVRCPCFLAGERLLVLPAFSAWSAGTDVRGLNFLSACTQFAQPRQAYAIIAGKLLPLRF